MDVILNPGDVLINCIAWPHAVENLDEITSAFSFRFQPKIFKRSTTWYNIMYMFNSLKDAFIMQYIDPTRLNMIDAMYHIKISFKTHCFQSF